MSSRFFILYALFVSVLLHLLVIFVLDLAPKEQESKEGEKEPIEIEILPKEEKEAEPMPVVPEQKAPPPVIIPPPPTEDIEGETTLDHDLEGGQMKGEKVEPQPVPPAKKSTRPAIQPEQLYTPLFESADMVDKLPKTADDTEPSKGIMDTKDITDRIAQMRDTPPKGEDTASYNAFEQKYASYFAKFRRRIYQQWQYPRESLMRGETGVVGVTFSILKDGTVVNIKMAQTSGYPELDREVMRVLKNIGKVPLPESYELEQLNIDEANFIYTIGGGMGKYIR